MSTKGYSSQDKENRLNQEFATVEPVREKQNGLSVNAHMYTYSVGTDAVEASSSTSVINATAHVAKKGDIIRITSGTLSSQEVKVASVSTNAITLAEDLASAPAAAVTFEILRPKYPVVNSDGTISVSAGSTKFMLNGALTSVVEDTGTPSNNTPLPVKLTSTTGDINITAGDLNVQLSHSGANYDSTRIGDGTTLLGITVSNEAKVADATARTSLASIDTSNSAINGKLGSLGQKAMAGSAPVVLASDQAAIPVTQSGTWNLTNISGTISLPTGAATSAKQDTGNTSLGNIDTSTSGMSAKFGSLGQKVMTGSAPVVIASDQSAIPASQSGTWSLTNISGTISLPTGASTSALQTTGNTSLSSIDGKFGSLGQKTMSGSAPVVIASDQGTLAVNPAGLSAVDKARNDYTSVSVSTSAYTQLIASTAAACKEVEIFDSSGQTLFLATGAAASESNKVYIFPGGNGRIPLAIASGTRISIKAVSATASLGEISINLYG